MKSFSISIYMVKVKNRIGTVYYPLDQLPPGKDFYSLAENYLQGLASYASNNSSDQEMLKVAQLETRGRSLSGLLERGEYGIQSELINIKSQKTTYTRLVDDAELMPYYFLLAIPQKKNQGILVIQRAGVSGVKESFEDDLERYIQNECTDCRLEIDRLVPSELIDQFLERGRIAKIRFVRFTLPSDIADLVQYGNREDNGTMELRIIAKGDIKSSLKQKIRKITKGQQNVKEFAVLKSFKYDTVKIEFEIEGKHRTVDLSEPENIWADYDVTKDIDLSGGHPTYKSINAVSREIVRDILKSLGLEVSGV